MWFKVDDKLHAHTKSRKAGKAAIGVWTLCGSWSSDNETDGFIPEDVLKSFGNRRDAEQLVAAKLWKPGRKDGENGWQFHDWAHFQPSAAVTAAKRAAEREAGIRGNHKRWHADRGISDPDCEYCYRVPDGEPDADPIGVPESAPIRPVPEPDPHTSPNGEVERARLDIDRICEHLADRIEGNGSRRPGINKGWLTAARLMLDSDGRTEADVHACIDWCQDDGFWRTNILSMPKLREKYDQLRLAAQRTTAPTDRRQAQTNAIFDKALAHVRTQGETA